MPVLSPARLTQTWQRLHGCQQGVAALEFALVLPVMVLIYLGMTEMTFAVNTNQKLTSLSRTVADLVARTSDIAPASMMDDIFKASVSTMAPYKTDGLEITVSSIAVVADKSGNPIGKVCWRQARGGAVTRPANETAPVPDGFGALGSFFIFADISMPYKAMFGADIFRAAMGADVITLKLPVPWPTRSGEVKYAGTGCTPAQLAVS